MPTRSIHDEDVHDDVDDLDDDGDAGYGGEAWSRQTWAIIVAALVVFGAIGGTLIYFGSGEGNVLSVELTDPSRAEDLFTFAYGIRTDRGAAAGQGTFTVLYGGEEVMTRQIQVANGGGRIDIRAHEYIMGNGEYFFRFVYGGMQDQSSYTIGIIDQTNFIVTSIRADAFLAYPDGGDQGTIAILVNFYSDQENNTYARTPTGTNLSLTVKKNGVTTGPPVVRAVGARSVFGENLTTGLGPGNYTVDAVFTNQWVRDDAPIKVLSSSNQTYVHNKPRACITPTTYRANNANNYTITFDAGCSTDDVGITDYKWFFDETGQGEVSSWPSPLEPHTFASTPHTYNCVLTVDDGGVPGGAVTTRQSDSIPFTVTVSFF